MHRSDDDDHKGLYSSFDSPPHSSRKFKKIYVIIPLCIIVAVIIIVVAVVSSSSSSSSSKYDGYCTPGMKCFPSSKKLDSFNKSINGRLHAERPIASVCYINDPTYNVDQCDQYTLNATSGRYRYDHFPTYQYANWEYCGSLNCSARTISTGTCEQGSVPTYAVYAESSTDVQKYVQFATKHNLRIVVKNTGHDILGRSSGKGGFAVWTHLLKSITVHDSFQPQGCKTNYEKAMSLGAGVQWAEAYTAIDPHGRTVVGGLGSSVGAAGGWVQGGGHSFLTPSYGLGADNLIEMEIVTADGKLRKISECSNPDLFWAVRGGGGGTWGVVTQITYQTRPSTPIYNAGVSFSTDINNSTFLDMLTLWTKSAPVLEDLGVGGATILLPGSLSGILVLPSSEASWNSLETALRPVSEWLVQQNVGSITYTNYTSWYDFYMKSFWTPDTVAGSDGGGSSPSRIIPRHYYENEPERLAETLLAGLKQSMGIVIIGHAAPVKLRHGPIGTSVNPIWYDSLWHVISNSYLTGLLRTLAPDGAVYFGESDTNEPNFAEGYWGSNYEKLKEVKKKWDPKGHFQVWHGVGTDYQNSEQWNCYS